MWVAVGASQVESSSVPLGGKKEEIGTIKASVGYGFGGKKVKLLNVTALDSNHGCQSMA